MFSVVEINISETCNLKCDFCPRANGYPNKKDYMSLEMAQIIADDISSLKFPVELAISGRGEPTMHPQFDDLVNIFLEKNIVIKLYTNGYNFEKYYDTIKKVQNLYYDVYTNQDDYQQAIEDTIDFPNNVLIYYKTPDGILKSKFKDHKLIQMNTNFMSNRAGYVSDKFKFKFKNSCSYLKNLIFLDWNGNYNLCCHDWGPTVLGNIKNQSLVEYYNNNIKLKEFRNGIKNNKRLFPCNRCDK